VVKEKKLTHHGEYWPQRFALEARDAMDVNQNDG